MSGDSLIVHQASLSEIEQSLGRAHSKLEQQVDDLMKQVDGALTGWGEETASRSAQMAYQRKLQASIKDLTAALDKIRETLSQVAEDAHDTEVKNVAIID